MMNSMERIQWKARGGRTCLALALSLSVGALAGCDELLEVDLPAQLGDGAVEDPAGAQTLVNTVIGHFESGWNWKVARSFGLEAGCEELLQSPGVFDFCVFTPTIDDEFYNPISISRGFAYQLHEKLADEWTVQEVPKLAQYLAISSIYAGATLEVMAEHLCEVTIDAGEMMGPMDTYAEAERWLTQALGEIQAVSGGDFEMPFGASSARAVAYGLRARVRWAMGNDAGALSDAAQVPQGFVAFATREPGNARMNLIANHTQVTGFVELYGMVDWWVGPPNPVTGQAWADPVPFTGYHYLGILPDGRAVTDAGYPIRTTETDDGMRPPDPHPGLEATAVRDTRIPHTWGILQGSGEDRLFQAKWTSEDDDLPWVNWKEMQLIAADIEGGQAAIDRVNVLRAADGLPLVTYADPNNAQQIRYMVLEERRRALFAEGRFYPAKLQNTDIAWFPRAAGNNLEKGEAYGGAVKFLMPSSEYLLNPNLTEADRATGCAPDVRPVNFT